jgi:hypothetical protein
VLGWHVAVAAVLLLLILTQPDEPPADCQGFNCLKPRTALMWLAAIFVVPALLGTFLVSVLAASFLIRRIESAFVAGTWSRLST